MAARRVGDAGRPAGGDTALSGRALAEGPLIRAGDHLLHGRVRELCLPGCEVGSGLSKTA